MTISASFSFEVQEKDSESWFDILEEEVLPKRFVSGKNVGAWFHFTQAIIAQTLEQMIRDAFILKNLKYNTNADEAILGHEGRTSGFLRYFAETNDTYKGRILTKWSAIQDYGTETGLLTELTAANYPNSFIDFDLAGTDIAVSGVKGGPENDIPPYPPTSEHLSQFNLNIIVTGSAPNGTGSLSNLLNDEELSDIRVIVKKLKPTQWVCREIVLVAGSETFWGQDGLDWNDPNFFWLAASASNTVERHRASY